MAEKFVARYGDITKDKSKYWVQSSWHTTPHISEEEKQQLLTAIPPYQRAARTEGIPQLGSGAIYPVAESDVTVPDFILPEYWPKGYGMDVGWQKTAAVFGALDRDSDTVYIYNIHLRGEAEPSVHAAAIQKRGPWMPGQIDPASRGRGQKDGSQLMADYQDLGLNLIMAINAREAGIFAVWERLSEGRLKVFASCRAWFEEFRFYRRDEKGQVVKKKDHLMDATRYLICGGVGWFEQKRVRPSVEPRMIDDSASQGWLA